MKTIDTVLLIDDNKVDSFINIKLLTLSNLASEIACSGSVTEALEYLNKYYDQHLRFPELIITDLNMPLIDGFQFIKTLKNDPRYSEKDTQIVVLTASLNYKKDKKKLGAISKNILSKPLQIEGLVELIAKSACK